MLLLVAMIDSSPEQNVRETGNDEYVALILQQSLKTGILHRFGFCQYKNYCQTSPTLGKIKEFYL
jgi:hypothetical protein